MASFRFDLALAALWGEVTQLNRELAAAKPWEDVKAGRLTSARDTLSPLVARLGAVGYWLTPFVPSTGEAIRAAVSVSPIRKCEPLFLRLAAK